MIKLEQLNINNMQLNYKGYKYPWFIKLHKGKAIVTIKDFNKLLNLDLSPSSSDNIFLSRNEWNALGKGDLREEFERINNVYYEEETFFYIYLSGFLKILKVLIYENKIDLLKLESILREFN